MWFKTCSGNPAREVPHKTAPEMFSSSFARDGYISHTKHTHFFFVPGGACGVFRASLIYDNNTKYFPFEGFW